MRKRNTKQQVRGGRVLARVLAEDLRKVVGGDQAPGATTQATIQGGSGQWDVTNVVEDDLLRAVPGIYQAVGAKAFELRVTVIGRRVLAAKILSQDTAGGRLDWRKAYGELRMEPFQLRAEIADLCIEMLARLGLVFGCFDFIVTPQGEYLFLEVNEMGQFLFVEHPAGEAPQAMKPQGRSFLAPEPPPRPDRLAPGD